MSIDLSSAPSVGEFCSSAVTSSSFPSRTRAQQRSRSKARGRFEQRQHRQGELAFAQIGPERLAGFGFRARDVEAIVVNLIGGADLRAVVFQPPNDILPARR